MTCTILVTGSSLICRRRQKHGTGVASVKFHSPWDLNERLYTEVKIFYITSLWNLPFLYPLQLSTTILLCCHVYLLYAITQNMSQQQCCLLLHFLTTFFHFDPHTKKKKWSSNTRLGGIIFHYTVGVKIKFTQCNCNTTVVRYALCNVNVAHLLYTTQRTCSTLHYP